jgi:glycine oxidase
MKIVIIGAGAAGLGIGWRLCQAGEQVTIVERARPGRGATWAAAGMIAVAGEAGGGNSAEAELSRQASNLWPDFARELEETSGSAISYRQSGALMVALNGEDLGWLPSGDLVERIDPAAAARLEPTLTRNCSRVLWAPYEAQVDNRALGTAMARAFVRAGGELARNETAVRIEAREGQAATLHTAFKRYDADAFILAAGAWSGLVDGVPSVAIPPVRPVKGQMIALEGVQVPSHIVRGSQVYLVPRGERVFVGATVEDVGFDTANTREASVSLFESACALVPDLERATIAEQWAGLRPGTPDGLPILGPTALAGLYAATGQHRNGILFVPSIADLLCRIVQGRANPIPAFDPRRFSSPACAEG